MRGLGAPQLLRLSRLLRPRYAFATDAITQPERATTSCEDPRLVPDHNGGVGSTRSAVAAPPLNQSPCATPSDCCNRRNGAACVDDSAKPYLRRRVAPAAPGAEARFGWPGNAALLPLARLHWCSRRWRSGFRFGDVGRYSEPGRSLTRSCHGLAPTWQAEPSDRRAQDPDLFRLATCSDVKSGGGEGEWPQPGLATGGPEQVSEHGAHAYRLGTQYCGVCIGSRGSAIPAALRDQTCDSTSMRMASSVAATS